MPHRAPKYSHAVIGDHNMRCDRCGAKAKFSELVFDAYYGLWVHPDEFDGMHPIDRHEAKPDDIAPPFIQPTPADRFDDTAVTKEGHTKSTSPVYDVGIPSATYEAQVAAGSVATGNFDDQDDTYAQHPDGATSGVVIVAPSAT